MELPVATPKVRTFEDEKLNLPKTQVVDAEGVGLCPVLAVGEGDVERGPGRAVDLDGLVESRRGVVDEPNADEVDAHCVVHARASWFATPRITIAAWETWSTVG